MTADRLRWQRRAACHGMWHLFFAAEGEKPGDRKWREAQAKAICSGCPVALRCLLYRLSEPQQLDSAIWGGRDELERRQLRRNMLRAQRRVALCPGGSLFPASSPSP
jgi:WhiB family transcriptional regulator, redox-sensing transcriptional regulator